MLKCLLNSTARRPVFIKILIITARNYFEFSNDLFWEYTVMNRNQNASGRYLRNLAPSGIHAPGDATRIYWGLKDYPTDLIKSNGFIASGKCSTRSVATICKPTLSYAKFAAIPLK
jgi:hypothetical protein